MKLKTAIAAIIMIFAAVSMASCQKQDAPVPYEDQTYHMGTIITEKIYGNNGEKAGKEAFERIGQLESLLTVNAPGSEIDKLNDQAGAGEVKLGSDSMYLLEKSGEYSEITDGNFDVTVGPLVKAWGIFSDNPRIPSEQEIKELITRINYRDVKLDKSASSAMLAHKGQQVDLGGIAKGYAGDEVIKVYKKYGIKSAFVNLGGNIVALGKKPDGTPWKIGIRNPRGAEGSYVGIIPVTDKAVVTSGDYERFYQPVEGGPVYHHILDPRTGYPADSGLMSATIVCENSTLADALSTATFIMGLEKGLKLIEDLDGVEAIFITKDKNIYVTSGLKDSFEFEDETNEYKYVKEG